MSQCAADGSKVIDANVASDFDVIETATAKTLGGVGGSSRSLGDRTLLLQSSCSDDQILQIDAGGIAAENSHESLLLAGSATVPPPLVGSVDVMDHVEAIRLMIAASGRDLLSQSIEDELQPTQLPGKITMHCNVD